MAPEASASAGNPVCQFSVLQISTSIGVIDGKFYTIAALKVNAFCGTLFSVKNIKLIVAYDGTHFLGWQKTIAGPSIEATLEAAVSQVLQHPVQLQAASRTDAGVHAEGQVVNFFTDSPLSLERMKKSFNALLPAVIRIVQVEEAHAGFHPTLDALWKEYLYDIYLGPVQLPFNAPFAWHFVKPVDREKMRLAANIFVGKHDFSALTNEKQEDNVREIYRIDIAETTPDNLTICVAGNRFLYKMVRNVVGTLLYVGCGMLTLEDSAALLVSGNRSDAGMTAPAHGLRLKKVYYD